MSYQFTDEELSHIRSLVEAIRNSGQPSDAPGLWVDAYRYVAELLEDKELANGSSPISDPITRQSWLFLTGAAMVNEGVGPFSAFIRSYAYRQAELRGLVVAENQMNLASNNVAAALFNQILDETNEGYLPTIEKILDNDLLQVSRTLFSESNGTVFTNNTAWPGTIVAPLFGTTFDYSTYLLGRDTDLGTVDDLVTVLCSYESWNYAYDIFAGLCETLSSAQRAEDFWKDVGLTLLGTAWSTDIGSSTLSNSSVLFGLLDGNAAEPAFRLVADLELGRTLDMLRGALTGLPVAETNNENFLSSAQAFFQSVTQEQLSQRLVRLDGYSPGDLAEAALQDNQTGLAYRSSLLSLSAFLLPDLDYSGRSQSLSLYDPASGTGSMTRQYIEQRARFLKERRLALKADLDSDPTSDISAGSGFDLFVYSDAASSYEVEQHSAWSGTLAGLLVDYHYVRFGGEGVDTLSGNDDSDYLFGGGGDDSLNGNEGGDYLEGGAGLDVLDGGDGADHLVGMQDADLLTGGKGFDHIEGGSGNDVLIGGESPSTDDRAADTLDGGAGHDIYYAGSGDVIRDSDGDGVIYFAAPDGTTKLLNGGKRISADVDAWRSEDKLYTYQLEAGTAERRTLRIFYGNGVITVENFRSGDLGINLEDASATGDPGVPPDNTITGTLVEEDPSYTRYVGNGLRNLITTNDDLNAIFLGSGGGVVQASDRSGIGGSVAIADGSDEPGISVSAGGAGDYLVTLNGGRSVVAIGDGDNRIYGDVEIGIAEAIVRANSAEATHLRGHFIAAGDGDNTVVGGLGDDLIVVGPGNNVIVAGPGNSTILGGIAVSAAGSSWTTTGDLLGGLLLLGIDHHPTPYASSGEPYDGIYSGATPYGLGNNTIFGGSGDLLVGLSNGSNYVDLGTGNSSVFGGMGDNTIFGGTGNVLIYGGGGNDYIAGEGGTDTLIGGSGDDIIVNADGDSLIYAGAYGSDWATRFDDSNYVDGGSGNVTIYGSGGNDTLIGGSGDALICAGSGDAYVVAGSGNTMIVGGTGNDTLIAGGDGRVTIVGAGDTDTTTYISGGGGVNVIQGGKGRTIIDAGDGGTAEDPTLIWASQEDAGAETTIYGGLGDQRFYGGPGKAVIYAGEGDSYVLAGTGDTTVCGGSGTDTIVGGAGINVLYSGDGGSEERPTVVVAGSGQATLYGGAGYAQLQDFVSGQDLLIAGSGQNTLFGSGADTLVAGSGTSYLNGDGGGGLTFRLDPGAGEAYLYNLAGDRIELNGRTAEELTLAATFDSQYRPALMLWGEGTSAIIEHGLTGAVGAIALDTETVDLRELMRRSNAIETVVQGARGALTFSVTDGEQIYAGDRQDTISSWGDNATLVAGSGDAIIYAGGDNTVAYGGAGADSLIAGSGDVTLVGSGGDTLVAGTGESHLEGSGSNTFEIGARTGHAVIAETEGQQTLSVGPGIDAADFTVTATVLDDAPVLRISHGASSVDIVDGLTDAEFVVDFVEGDAMTLAALMQERGTSSTVTDTDGTTLFDVGGHHSIVGGENIDRITAWGDADTIVAGNGGTEITVYGDNGSIHGGSGNDILVSYGDNQLDGGAGYDSLTWHYANGDSTTEHTQDGRRLDREWSSADGSHGNAVYGEDGSSTGVTYYADGRYSSFIDDGVGLITSRNYSATGVFIGSSTDTYGGSRQVHTEFDINGIKTSERWTGQDGSYGNSSYDADGSSTGVTYHANGTRSTYTNDGRGNVDTLIFDVHGVKISRGWIRADGSYGSDAYHDGGSSSGISHYPNGTYSRYWDDGQGTLEVVTYAADGTVIGNTLTLTDGAYAETSDDGFGNVTKTIYDSTGRKIGAIWTKADGTHGNDAFAADGSSSGITYYPDGAYTSYADDARGRVTTRNYTWEGTLTGSRITQTNGLNNVVIMELDATGTKVSERWIHGDGTSGTDLVSSRDFNGDLNFVYQSGQAQASLGGGQFDWSAPDGASGMLYYDRDQYDNVDSIEVDTETFFGTLPNSTVEPYDFTFGRSWFNGEPDNFAEGYYPNFFAEMYELNYDLYILIGSGANGWQDIEYADAVFDTYAYIYRREEGAPVQVYLSNGQAVVPHSGTYTIPSAQGYNIFTFDGLGNSAFGAYSLDGSQIRDQWIHNDGSHGMDWFNADGSQFGVAVYQSGISMAYADDGHGQVSITEYPGANPLVERENDPPPSVTPSPPSDPGQPNGPFAFPFNGLPSNVIVVGDGNGGEYTYVYLNDGHLVYKHTDASGNVTEEGYVDLDPGYGISTTVGNVTYGWDYDVDAKPISNYVDDGQGNVVRYSYDEQGVVDEYSVSQDDGSGNVTTYRYDTADQLIGSSIQVANPDGAVTTTRYDEMGAIVGSTVSWTSAETVRSSYTYDDIGTLLSLTQSVVTAPGVVTTTAYAADGTPTNVWVNTIADGRAETVTYDGSGSLIVSTVLVDDGTGTFYTSNYNPSGELINYIVLSPELDGSSSVATYNRNGIEVRSNTLSSAGAVVYREHLGNGSTVTTSRNVDRSYSIALENGLGDSITTQYSADDIRLGATWARADRSYGTATFDASGGSTGVINYADGTSSSYVDDGHGQITTQHYGSDGIFLTGSSITTRTESGTRTVHYDALGQKTGASWASADGTFGQDVYNGDGTYSSTINDGMGGVTTILFDASGIALSESRHRADGTISDSTYRVFAATGENQVVNVTGEGAATLVGSYRGDTLVGGFGPNTFVVGDSSVVVQDSFNHGSDVIQASVNYTLPEDVNFLILTGSANISGTGNAGNSVIVANAGNNTLISGGGIDTLIGGAGNDTYVVNNTTDVVQDVAGDNVIQSSVSYVLPENVNTLILTGTDDVTGTGNGANNRIVANSGNDTLISGAGIDTLVGGIGNDLFVINDAEDLVQSGQNQGRDTIQSAVSYLLPDHVEQLELTGTADLTATGNAGDHVLVANDGDDTLIAGSGLATLIGGAGSDTFMVNKEDDVVRDEFTTGDNVIQSSVSYVLPDNVHTLILAGDDALAGGAVSGNNRIVANDGGNTLTSGLGIDTLIGGAGNDTFVVNNTTDVVQDIAGDNVIQSSASYVLPENVNTLILTGSDDVTGTGNGTNNRIVANSGNDTLISGSGIDTLVGGIGNDLFVVNDAEDLVQSAQSQGRDTIQSSVSYVLPDHVEQLELIGTENLTATGNAGDHVLVANDGDDTLIAGSGLATLIGGTGSDTFIVNHVDDVVQDDHATGNNVIESSVSYVLPENVKTLLLTGNGNVTGRSNNSGNNLIVGNAGNDTLIAGSGGDTLIAGTGLATLIGGAGSDTFIVNRTGDVVLDDYTTGNNVIESSVSYVLPTNVDTLILTGTAQLTGTGNAGDDLIVANDAGNTLVSGTGTDTLQGGAGSDVFVVNNTGDIVEDSHTTGNNVIETSVNYVLPDHVNTLLLSGSGNLSVSGNAANNLIIGNAGNDTLASGGGNDTLAAGSGVATLIGGAGNDTFIVNHASDVVQDSDVGDTNVILSSASYVLPTNVSTLILTGSANLSATGNSARGLLVGNAGNHTLTAGSGGDTLVAGSGLATLTGGAGSDVFIINNTSDVVRDSNAAAGNVLVASASYTLPTNINTLVLTGSGNLVGTGNGANNLIYGNAGNSTLNGGSGTDTLIGGSGNDFFMINSQDDVVVSGPGQGKDTLRSTVSYTLPENVRTLMLADAFGGTTATGNSQDHILMATVGDVTLPGGFDTLNAGSGKAILYGGTGQTNNLNALHNSAALIGGTGNNWFSSGNYRDFIGAGKKGTPANFDWIKTGASTNVIAVNGGDGLVLLEPTAGCSNTLSLGGGIDTGSLTFNKVNTDLILTDTLGDTIRFTNWYGGTSQHSVTKLQVMEFASALYDSNSANSLKNRKVYEFDFNALVAAFDQARVANPLLLNWSLTGALPSALIATSDTTAIGGDLAYAYATNGFSSLETDTVFEALGSSDFAMTAQAISAWQSLQPESDPGTTTQSDSGSSSESSTEPVNYVTAEQMPSIWDFMNTRLNDLLLAGPAGGATTLDAISQEVAGLQTVATQVLSAVQADSALLQQRSAHA